MYLGKKVKSFSSSMMGMGKLPLLSVKPVISMTVLYVYNFSVLKLLNQCLNYLEI